MGDFSLLFYHENRNHEYWYQIKKKKMFCFIPKKPLIYYSRWNGGYNK